MQVIMMPGTDNRLGLSLPMRDDGGRGPEQALPGLPAAAATEFAAHKVAALPLFVSRRR
ncbi:hypothetical protein AB0892_23470 [Streptomyces sp. NPDC005409]|uniref:hypothetical protein n=1 Tax=Streptomyces sp. NPDC005409 TaxID=3155342 RepID=UPI003452C4CE